ncbi:MAG: peptide-methionine (R)-S-oxide reductase MsrB [Bacteroidia bacterium]
MLKWNDIMAFATKGNPKPDRRLDLTESEWRERLSEDDFYILRQHGTERSFTGAYCESHDPGLYQCKGCDNLLFDSSIKFESGTGWPSFTQPISENSIKYIKDTSFGMVRVEIQCNVCDGHLGHVFPDGPAPSKLRYCVNSASIKLKTS